jgi:allantoinase
MASPDLIIRGRNVVLPDSIGSRSIHVRDGVIESVRGYDEIDADCELIEADENSVVMPGLVDTHVHVNSPGRTDWEGFPHATSAAAAGGTTTLIDMPLNSIPATTTLAAFKTKLADATGKCLVDVGFWGGVVPGNTAELEPMLEAGVVGFKCFLVPSGVDEFQHVTEDDLREAMPELSRLDALLIVHAELPGPIDSASVAASGSVADYQTFLDSRPRAAENEAVKLMIRLSREFGTRVHIVHLSSSDAVPLLREARADGVAITAETCPHYLHFAADEVPSCATEFKCCPPIRERGNRERLWDGLAEGTIDMIVSDHSPCPVVMKEQSSGDFLAAWGGISSLQLRLPIVWTEAQRRGYSFHDLAKWLCENPARQVKLESRKGMIVAGHDADFVIWDPQREFVVNAADLHHRHKVTPYHGQLLSGAVRQTFLRGKKIYDRGKLAPHAMGVMLVGDS